MIDSENHRHNDRVRVAIAVTEIRRGGRDGTIIDAPVGMCDISADGVCLDTPLPVSVDEPLYMAMLLPTGKRVEVQGKVRWVRLVDETSENWTWDDQWSGAAKQRLGIEIISCEPEDQAALHDYLHNRPAA